MPALEDVAAAQTHVPAITFCDLETDELAYPWLPDGRRIWEIRAIVRSPGEPDIEHDAFISVADLKFDPGSPGHTRRVSLDIGGIYQRHP